MMILDSDSASRTSFCSIVIGTRDHAMTNCVISGQIAHR